MDYSALAQQFGGVSQDAPIDYAALAQKFGGQPLQTADSNMVQDIAQGAGNLLAGAVRGAGSIGSTIISPLDALGVTGMTNTERRAAIDAGLQEMGADPNSLSYKGGKLAAEIAGTAGVGGALGKGLGLISQSPKALALAEALGTGGLSADDAGMLTRIAGGAISGGATTGLINPSDTGTGAVIGGLLPPGVAVAGEIGKGAKALLYDPLMNKGKLLSNSLLQAVGPDNVDAVITGLETQAQTPGVKFSAGTASMNPALNAIEDTLRAKNASGALGIQQTANNTALVTPMRKLAQDQAAIDAAALARSNATEPLYSAMQDKMFAGGDDLTNLLNRNHAMGTLQEAKQLAAGRGHPFSIPVVEEAIPAGFQNADDAARAAYAGMRDPGTVTIGSVPQGMPEAGNSRLLAEIRKLGGVSTKDMADLVGERATNKAGAQVGVFTKSGEEVGDMVRRLVDNGIMPRQVLNDVDGGAQALRDAIQQELHGGADNMAMRAAAESYYGAPEVLPLARETMMTPATRPQEIAENAIGQAIKGRDLQSVKMGIDQALSTATGPRKTVLMQLKSDFLDWMGKQSQEYLKANGIYSDLSRPINQMEVAQSLTNKFIPATAGDVPTRLNANALAQALRNPDQVAKQATGFNGAVFDKVMEPEQAAMIRGISSDASRLAEARALGAGYGSPTARRLSVEDFIGNNLREAAPTINSLVRIMSGIPGVNYLTKGGAAVGNMIGGKINQNMAMQLEDMLANNPQLVAQALREASQRGQSMSPLLTDLLRTTPLVAIAQSR